MALGASATLLVGVRDLHAGRASFDRAVADARRRDTAALRLSLTDAREAFERASARLSSPWLWPVRAIPVAGRQLEVARAVAAAGVRASGVIDATGVIDDLRSSVRMTDGRFDLDAIARAARRLDAAVPPLTQARRILEATPDRLLLPPVADARTKGIRYLRDGERTITGAAGAARIRPARLGADGDRRYFVAFANLAELRGSGGFIGYFGVLEAGRGRVRLDDVGRPTEELPGPDTADLRLPDWYTSAYARRGGTSIWQSVNVTSDFPTAADIIVQTLRQPRSIGRVDGVVQLDPVALAPLLRVTGPVTVPLWPDPIDADTVGPVVQHGSYVRFGPDSDRRFAFLGQVVRAIAAKLFGGSVTFPADALSGLGDAVAGGHVRVYSTHPDERAVLRELGVDGAVARASDATDVLGVVTQNWSGTKIDWFLRRSVRYRVTLDPAARSASARLDVELRNEAPADGLPPYVIGPYNEEVRKGWNRQFVVLLRPPDDRPRDVRIDGDGRLAHDREASLGSYSAFVSVPPRGSSSVEAGFAVPDAMTGRGRERTYRLHVLRQPVAHPDTYDIEIVPPRGWTVTGRTRFDGPLLRDEILEVRLRQTTRAWLIDRLLLDPLRLLRSLL